MSVLYSNVIDVPSYADNRSLQNSSFILVEALVMKKISETASAEEMT